MAKLTVVNPQPVQLPPKRYILDLSEREAVFIKKLVGRSRGDLDGHLTHNLYNTLVDVPEIGTMMPQIEVGILNKSLLNFPHNEPCE